MISTYSTAGVRWQDADPGDPAGDHTGSGISDAAWQDLRAQLARAQEVVQDMTAVIGAKVANERDLAERIAARAGHLFDLETSDLELDELIDGLLEYAVSAHIQAEVQAMEPEDAPGVFLVLNADGRITGPVHDSDAAARAYVQQCGRASSAFMVVRRVATCTTRIVADWKEG